MTNQDSEIEVPQWTDIGRDSGIDPLGMQRPIEIIYQTLIPGMTTITERFRYYSFFSWLLYNYIKSEATNDLDEFRNYHRRAEALYALICEFETKDRGAAGANWASNKLKEQSFMQDGVIDFAQDSNPKSSSSSHYLQRVSGAFGGIYSGQMKIMRMIDYDDDKFNEVPLFTERGEELALGFEESLGNAKSEFLTAIESGTVHIDSLRKLRRIRPSNISESSKEQEELTSFLFVGHNSATEADKNRSKTLLMILNLAISLGCKPTENEIKWFWFCTAENEKHHSGDTDHQKKWKLYQMNDLLRLSYETLLYRGLVLLKNSKNNSLSLNDLVNVFVDSMELPEGLSVENWIQDRLTGQKIEIQIMEHTEIILNEVNSENPEILLNALTNIFLIAQLTSDSDLKLMQQYDSSNKFQSVFTEVTYLKNRFDFPVKNVVSDLLRERIFIRHIAVATRKLRNQNSYTFLFEADEYGLRYRDNFRISASSPRLIQSLQFLEDVKYLNEEGITQLGLNEVEKNEIL